MLELVYLMSEDRQEVRSDKFWKSKKEEYQGERGSSIEEQNNLHEENGPVNSNLMSREVQVGSRVKSVAEASAYRI